MARTLSKQSHDQIDAIVASARRIRDPGPLPGKRAALLRTYCADVSENDLLSAEPEYLATAVLSHLDWGRTRTPGEAKLRVFNPDPARDGWASDHTVIQLVNDNMPFLVDSIMMRLNELGRSVHQMMHPLLNTVRGRGATLKALGPNDEKSAGRTESFIHIEIGKEVDETDLDGLRKGLERTLADVRAAVEDWQPMLAALRAAGEHIRSRAARRSDVFTEACALIDWLAEDHFTLHGYREYRLRKGRSKDSLVPIDESGLGVLRDDPQHPAQPLDLVGADQRAARARNPLLVTKSRSRSTVHRAGHLDQISIKLFDQGGNAVGVGRFVGLFTSTVYSENPLDIPMLRLKVAEVMRESELDPKGHRGKALRHILDTFPRDDLFQISVKDLARISFGILDLQERHQVRLFCRRDALSRYYSCFVYLPRDHYTARARRRIERILLGRFAGEYIETKVTISESTLARVEATIRCSEGIGEMPPLDALENELREAVASWEDRLRTVLLEKLEEERALRLQHRFSGAFPASYQDEVDPVHAAEDIEALEAVISGERRVVSSLMRRNGDQELVFRICRRGEPIPLYMAAPILERMGVRVLSERVYRIDVSPELAWIQEFDLSPTGPEVADAKTLEQRFTSCFCATLDGLCENDGLNAFVLLAGLEWREVVLLRAFTKYLLQTRLPFSLTYMRQVLARDAAFTRALVEQFHGHFDPELSASSRHDCIASTTATINEALERVTNLDEDRIMRAFVGVLDATLRTNFFQRLDDDPKPYVALKLDPRKIPELPRPRPMYEIFVFSPRVEGVHLRCGRISRGGLRWSDRREDFRTEILGLMKAQQVKNTIIVPTGAKGGFVCKKLPTGDRDAVQAEVVACYKTLVRGLLDVTDNIVDDKVVPPPRVLRRDDDDPYLVVAADKGTATFSDLANRISSEYSFWLGDAFASGGSAGYDHKRMGITARGAWESVRRHFRELGIDPERESFTTIGIGDMSGDVFGNGLLLSQHIKLIAAFNHRHIFIDPDPNPVKSYAERKRLFELPRSGWDDYAADAISEGGGVYSRQVKSIELHPKAQDILGLERPKLTPPELIRAILRMPVDLLWNGGVGTYVKASTESHSDAGDPTNDSVRIDASSLRCKVVAEGGNLGLTQRARIEFALKGGRVNADFIDNAGGVDSSDREVNIKILLDILIRGGKLQRNRRNRLLADMTEALTALVLDDNYAQSQALSVLDAHSADRLGEHGHLIRYLENRGVLDRGLESLPSEDVLSERAAKHTGLARPELAVIFSFAKIALTDDILSSDLPDDLYFDAELVSYFPPRLRRRYADTIPQHRLRREIIAMRIANEIVNRMGPAFAFRARDEAVVSVGKTVRAYAIARDIFSIDSIWHEIDATDALISPALKYELLYHVTHTLRHATYWILHRHPHNLVIADLVAVMRPAAREIGEKIEKLESGRGRKRRRIMIDELTQMGVDSSLARRIAMLSTMTDVLDIFDIVETHGSELAATARLFFELGDGLEIDQISEKIDELEADSHWQAVARDTLRQNLSRHRSALVGRILSMPGDRSARAALVDWFEHHGEAVGRIRKISQEIQTQAEPDFATLSVAIREIERLG